MSTELDTHLPSADDYERYRALSTTAVASVIVGLLSAAAILDWTLVAIPVIGVALATFALVKVRRNSAELSGEGLAKIGLTLSLAFGVLGPAWLTYVYFTEVPEGYERVSYADLQPEVDQPGQVVPPAAMELEGRDVFIKGYIYPGREKNGIRQFLLVRDQGDCCFGGNPKLTDRIQVTMKGGKSVTFQPRLHKVAGKFHVAPMDKAVGDAKGGVFYHLEAEYVQ